MAKAKKDSVVRLISSAEEELHSSFEMSGENGSERLVHVQRAIASALIALVKHLTQSTSNQKGKK